MWACEWLFDIEVTTDMKLEERGETKKWLATNFLLLLLLFIFYFFINIYFFNLFIFLQKRNDFL